MAAFEAAVRALARRDLTETEVLGRLERAGFDAATSAEAVRRLIAAGYLDDARAALERARVLAARNASDAAIRADLTGRGAGRDVVEEVIETLEPERERAVRIVRASGAATRIIRALARRGFSEDAIRAALAAQIAEGEDTSVGFPRTTRHFACTDAVSESEP